MDSIEAYTAFALLLQHRNFSAVARKMGISQSTVSKHIASLEQAFQLQLFVRNTRSVSPTIEANRLSEHVEQLLESLKAVRASAAGQTPDLDGELRLAMPADFGRARIMPLVPEFLALHGALTLKVTMGDNAQHLAPDQHDLTITTSVPSTMSLIKRTLKIYPRQVVCSPDYLARHGEPQVPLDLENHTVMVPTELGRDIVDFDSDDGRQRIRVNGTVETNDVQTVYDFARKALAIAIVPSWLCAEHTAEGSMKRLLTDYYLPPVEVSIVYPPTSFLSRRARLFIDFLVARLAPGR